MQVRIPYKDLTHTLQSLKIQVIDSLQFANQFVPELKDPKKLFEWLRPQLKYKKDPDLYIGDKKIKREYIQMFPTLMDNDGKGDCDCFSVASLASNYSLGFRPLFVTLAGNSRIAPTHIYTKVYDPQKKKSLPLILQILLTVWNGIINLNRTYLLEYDIRTCRFFSAC